MAARVYVVRVAEGPDLHVIITRVFKGTSAEADSRDFYQRTKRVYEMKANNKKISYNLTLAIQDKKGIKDSKVLEVLFDERISPHHH